MKIRDVLLEIKIHRMTEPEQSQEDEFDIGADELDTGDDIGDEFDLPLDDSGDDDTDELGDDSLAGDEEGDPSDEFPEFNPDEGGSMPSMGAGGGSGGRLSPSSVSTPTDNTLDDTDELDGNNDSDPDSEVLDDISGKTSEDPDKQGLIRTIKGAKLVYKRQTEDGTYSELWLYNSDKDKVRDNINTRKAILAGTDITSSKTSSPDGGQTYELWNSGNVEMMLVKGLPN